MPELVAAHLILALYWTHQMDSSKITRYVGLAHQSNDIVRDRPGALAASLKFVSVVLFDAKVGGWVGGQSEGVGSDSTRGAVPLLLRCCCCCAAFLVVACFLRQVREFITSVTDGLVWPSLVLSPASNNRTNQLCTKHRR